MLGRWLVCLSAVMMHVGAREDDSVGEVALMLVVGLAAAPLYCRERAALYTAAASPALLRLSAAFCLRR